MRSARPFMPAWWTGAIRTILAVLVLLGIASVVAWLAIMAGDFASSALFAL